MKPQITIALAMLAMAAAPAAAQQQPPVTAPGAGPPPPVELPNTPAGNAARTLVAALNAGDDASLHAWAEAGLADNLWMGWTAERAEAMLRRLRDQGGGVDPVRLLDRGEPNYLGVFLRARNGAGRTGLEIITRDDGRVHVLELHPMKPPAPRAEWPEERLGAEAAAAAVERRMDALAAADRFSGVVLLAHGGRVLLHRAYGTADRDAGRANTLDTRVSLGSVPKMMTAVAVAQLVEAGRLRWTDTLGALLPDYPNEQARRQVTIHHLLTHTAGIVDPFASSRRDPDTRYRTPSEWLALVADLPLDFAPGERHQYSNGGYAVLARIVEAASGQPFGEYLRQHVFAPAGMAAADSAGYHALPWAVGYTIVPEHDPFALEPRRPNDWIVRDAPAETFPGFGGAHMTAEDVYRFLQALREGRLVGAETVRTLMEGKVEIGPGVPVRYGYGFYDDRGRAVPIVGHSGGGASSGIGAEAEMVGEWTLVVLGNYDLEQDVRPIVFDLTSFLAEQSR